MSNTQSEERSRLFRLHTNIVTQRYANALEHFGADRALVCAGVPLMRDRDDQPYPFRADPYFLQWVPLPEAAGSIIEIRPGHKPHLLLARDDDFWHAPPELPPQYVLDHIDVTSCTPGQAASQLAATPGKAVCIGPSSTTIDVGDVRVSGELIDFLDFDRAIKTEYEIDCMKRANRRAAEGHRAVARALRDGISEFELHLRYCEAAGLSDAGLPYPSIIGLNEHAATLHYQRRDTSAPPHIVSLLIDAGAEDQGYAADVTRTYALDDEPFSALIVAMDDLQRKVCANTTAGADFVALNELCHQCLAQVLFEFDLISCSAETAWDHGVTTAFLPHGLGHLLGLQVHDVGGHSLDRLASPRNPPQRHPFLRLTRTLEADMVVTIEPGIYFIEPLIDALERDKPGILRRATAQRFMKFGGIRIEDNLRVESRGHENLTRSAFGE